MDRVRLQFLLSALWIILMGKGETMKLISGEDEDELALPYWDPEPKVNARRNHVGKNFTVLPIGPIPHLRGRHQEPTVKWSSHENDPEMTKRPRRTVKVAEKYKYYSDYNDSHSGLRHVKNNNILRSTRVAPLHLMQQEPDLVQEVKPEVKPELKTEQKDLFAEPFILNAYDIKAQISKILSQFSEIEFSSEVLGHTVSYVDIVLFKILEGGSKFFRAHETKYVESETKEKKILFIVHGLSPMGLGHLFSLTLESHIKLLISYYVEHLDKFDIYLIPMANPDGYLLAKINNVYWNKNGAINAQCSGVDVDRNFDVAWTNLDNGTQTEMSSCSQHYPGPSPFSEPESRAVRDVLHRMSHKIVAYFHVHGGTYSMDTFKGDAVLYPKGYTDQTSDDDKYVDLKGEIDEAMKSANFKVLSVSVDSLYNWYGKVTGSSVDYASSVYGIPYAMELVMQLYQDNFWTPYNKMTKLGGGDFTSMDNYSLSQIWKRVIDTIFTSIHKKLEETEPARHR